MNLSDLVSRLSNAVPARNSVPSAAQYEQAVQDAIIDLNQRAPRTKISDIQVVAGQASYALPGDFVFLISITNPFSPDGILVAEEGIIPLSGAMPYTEKFTISNGLIRFYPTPAYTMTREIDYAAGHVLDDGAYAELSEREASLALYHAQAACLTLQANVAAREAWQYQLGDERVNKERLAGELREQARELERQYLTALEKSSGSVLMFG